MCPAGPISINLLPHCSAKYFARSIETQGSSVLATTIVGKFILVVGIGSKPVAGKVYAGVSISLGATSNAPLIIFLVCPAQCAIVVQPRLCPMSTTVLGS